MDTLPIDLPTHIVNERSPEEIEKLRAIENMTLKEVRDLMIQEFQELVTDPDSMEMFRSEDDEPGGLCLREIVQTVQQISSIILVVDNFKGSRTW